jgi:hypothetical protein
MIWQSIAQKFISLCSFVWFGLAENQQPTIAAARRLVNSLFSYVTTTHGQSTRKHSDQAEGHAFMWMEKILHNKLQVKLG